MSKKSNKSAVVRKSKAKKGFKKKVQDPFLKKEWYVIKLPKYMGMDGISPLALNVPGQKQQQSKHRFGYSCATKGKAKKAMADRIFEINLADIMTGSSLNGKNYDREKDHECNFKKYKFIVEEVWGAQLLTQWHGMQITRDKKCSLFRKWHTLITAFCDVKTIDGYLLRVKALAFTKKQLNQLKKNCYAKHSQCRRIRAKMKEIIKNNISSKNIDGLIKLLNNGTIGKEIEKSCQLTFPLKTCLIEKVKVLKKPKKDSAKILQMHDLNAAFSDIEDEGNVVDQSGQIIDGSQDIDDATQQGNDNSNQAPEVKMDQ